MSRLELVLTTNARQLDIPATLTLKTGLPEDLFHEHAARIVARPPVRIVAPGTRRYAFAALAYLAAGALAGAAPATAGSDFADTAGTQTANGAGPPDSASAGQGHVDSADRPGLSLACRRPSCRPIGTHLGCAG